MKYDTIAALATPPGAGAIAVIRISGPEAFSIINKITPISFRIDKISTHTCKHVKIIDNANKDIVDDVVISVFKSPKSYTGEDVIEISSHGGGVIPYRILNLIFNLGARAAQRGEFTKRAFLNNKMDLTQAEAVADLIASPTVTGTRLALSNIFRRFSKKIDEMKNSLIDLLAHIEVCIDYPDDGIPETDEKEINNLKNKLEENINKILKDSKKGRRLSDGIIVVLTGKTNVGKSSLLNYLAREERAIVSGIHGTTRDALEINIELEGVPLTLVDTAGLREAGDELEIMGKEKTHKYLEEAHLVLFVLDSSRDINGEDIAIYNKIKPKDYIVVLNKTDIEKSDFRQQLIDNFGNDFKYISISALQKSGINIIENELTEWVRGHEKGMDENAIVASIRSEKLLHNSLVALNKGIEAMKKNEPPEFLALLFREALDAFGEITGEVTTEDVLSRIFENFCVGK